MPTETSAVDSGVSTRVVLAARQAAGRAAIGASSSPTMMGAGKGAGLVPEASRGAACTGARSKGAVLCVDARSGAGGAGTASRPFSSIQAAIGAARDGDTIQVAAGRYRENIRVQGKTVRLLGGFRGLAGGTGSSGSRFDPARAPARSVSTIASPGGDAAVSLLQAGRSVLDGFRVTGGSGHEGDAACCYFGGGVFVSEGSPRIAHNLIEGNDVVSAHPKKAADSAGGALFAENGRIEIVGNVIRDNRSGRGALAVSGGTARIAGNVVENNLSVGDHGGGLYLSGPKLSVTGNLIRGNILRPQNGEGGWGGGLIVYDKGTNVLLERNVVTGNYAPEIGSGEFIDDGARATIRNELIVANRCSDAGSGLYVDGLDAKTRSSARLYNVTIAGHRCRGRGHGLYVENSSVTLRDSIVWGNGGDDFHLVGKSRLSARYTLSEEKIAGQGNLRRDPLFAAPPRDFHLQSTTGRWAGRWLQDARTSSAIDAGDPQTPAGDETAPNGGRANLGAYGGTSEASRSARTK